MVTRAVSRLGKTGLPPGTPVHVGLQRVAHTTVQVIDYNADRVEERAVEDPAECRAYRGNHTVSWINVTGLHDIPALEAVGRAFDLHPLMLEDICNTGQRPRCEDHGDTLFIVIRMLYRRGEDICSEQVSLLLGEGFVLSFQEVEGDVFGLIRERIRKAQGRIRTMGADYLMYALVDAIVDHYFVVLEDLAEQIEQAQERVLEAPGPEMLQTLHGLKRDLVALRRSLGPARELAATLEKSDHLLLSAPLRPYLRDVYEHTVQVVDAVDSLRELLTSAMDIHFTAISNRMNEVMKVLTLIATVFIPLTFVAGVYGMNFEYMPELHWRYGYAGAWAVMLLLALGMAVYFRRRHWM